MPPLATERQINYLKKLYDERKRDDETLEELIRLRLGEIHYRAWDKKIEHLPRDHAGRVIDMLKQRHEPPGAPRDHAGRVIDMLKQRHEPPGAERGVPSAPGEISRTGADDVLDIPGRRLDAGATSGDVGGEQGPAVPSSGAGEARRVSPQTPPTSSRGEDLRRRRGSQMADALTAIYAKAAAIRGCPDDVERATRMDALDRDVGATARRYDIAFTAETRRVVQAVARGLVGLAFEDDCGTSTREEIQ